MTSSWILSGLRAADVAIVASLPDSWISDLLGELDDAADIRHVRLNREDEGVGLCLGAHLAGVRAALVCQNAGLLLSTNALAAAARHHHAPFIVLAVQRGRQGDPYPYQAYKGEVTASVLSAIGLPFYEIEAVGDPDLLARAYADAEAHRSPVAILLDRRALGEPGS